MTVPQGSTFTYGYDAMARLSTVSENGGQIASATYNVAGQLATLAYDGATESRTYNPLPQLTRMTTTSGASVWMDTQYIFPAGQNNGRVSQTVDNVTGETVTYG